MKNQTHKTDLILKKYAGKTFGWLGCTYNYSNFDKLLFKYLRAETCIENFLHIIAENLSLLVKYLLSYQNALQPE